MQPLPQQRAIEVKFSATKIPVDKKGILKPNADGYYRVILGGLNTYNYHGIYYLSVSALKLLQKDGVLMRKIKDGSLYGEADHPDRNPSWNDKQYFDRLRSHDISREALHIASIEIDFEYGKNNPTFNNPNLVAIYGEVKPTGPYGQYLKEALENGRQNVSFSIRSIVAQFWRSGVLCRDILEICTWDWVTEGGIEIARKWNTPGLEKYMDDFNNASPMVPVDLGTLPVTRSMFTDVLTGNKSGTIAGVESIDNIEKKELYNRLFNQKSNTNIIDTWSKSS